MTTYQTNLRKMRTSLSEDGIAMYSLPLYNALEPIGNLDMNPLVGQEIQIDYLQEINCIESGKRIKKTFGEGLSYEVWLKSAAGSPSIIRPELSRIHEGVALRDYDWEMANHNQPHYVYLCRTSGVKVGVTRSTNKISRWIDQGAIEGILLAETPYRQLAGLIEVALKDHLPDKTAWQAMLKSLPLLDDSLLEYKNRMLELLPLEWENFFSDDDEVTTINYPVLRYPFKIKSLKLDTTPSFTGKLMGIKGQYFIFEDGSVFNVRSHAGYRINLNY